MAPSTREHMIKSVAMTAHVLAQSSGGPSDARGDAPLGGVMLKWKEDGDSMKYTAV